MFHTDRALQTVANETLQQALKVGHAYLGDLRIYVLAVEDGKVEISDLYTDEILNGPLEAIIAHRLRNGVKD